MPGYRRAGKAASNRDRRVDFSEPRERILIVCEGEQTEPNYFRALVRYHRLNSVFLDDGRQVEIAVDGAGRVTMSLVEYAESLQRSGREWFAEIWYVFDKDRFPNDQFDNAIGRTRNHSFLRAAWSNEAFELWYVLHFQYLDHAPAGSGGTARTYYVERLHELMRELGETATERTTRIFTRSWVTCGERRRFATPGGFWPRIRPAPPVTHADPQRRYTNSSNVS